MVSQKCRTRSELHVLFFVRLLWLVHPLLQIGSNSLKHIFYLLLNWLLKNWCYQLGSWLGSGYAKICSRTCKICANFPWESIWKMSYFVHGGKSFMYPCSFISCHVLSNVLLSSCQNSHLIWMSKLANLDCLILVNTSFYCTLHSWILLEIRIATMCILEMNTEILLFIGAN